MKKSRRLIDEHAGVALGYGATRQTNFSLSDGIVNGINLYAAREISWNIDANLDDIGKNWAGSIYGKRASMEDIDEMFREFALAQPNLRPEQASELETRFNWLREFAICRKYLDISLWRYRYLRHLAAMLTTDPDQMKYLAEAYDESQKALEGAFSVRSEPEIQLLRRHAGAIAAQTCPRRSHAANDATL